MKKLFLLTAALFFAICLTITYMVFVEPQLLITTHETLYIPNWNKKLNGLKIGVVSDPHIGHGFTDIKKLENIVEKVNDQKPDLIFLLGDFDAQSIEDSKISKKEISNTLDDLKAKYGIVAILGNHDYKPPCVIKKILRQANIPLLEDKSKYFSINGQTIRVVGFKDLWHSNPNPIKTIGKPPYKTPKGDISLKTGDAICFPANENGSHVISNPSKDEKLIYLDFGTSNKPDIVHFTGTDAGMVIAKTGVYNFKK